MVKVGLSVSLTVTVNEQLVSGLSVLPSLAMQLTVVVPDGNCVPDAGEHVIVGSGQLSLALAV